MCIQYVPIEGHGVSMVKVVAMSFAPFIFIASQPVITKALIWGACYYGAIVFSTILNPTSLRFSTLIYHAAFLFTFIVFYGLVRYNKVYNAESFLRILKGIIIAYTIVLLIQQLFILVGIHTINILNNYHFLDRGLGANSLTLEPSHTARLMIVAFLCLLRMYEIKYGGTVSFELLRKEAKWTSWGFLWSMLTMGSATAFVCLGILFLYFLKQKYALVVAILLFSLYMVIPHIQVESLQRSYRVINAFTTGDQDKITETDASASGRINPLLNTIQYIDLSDVKTWIGYGVDTKLQSKRPFIGCIQDYGLLAFILMQILIYSCVIRKLVSIESILWIFIFGMAFQNFAYTFGAMMMLSATSYFQDIGEWSRK